MTKDGDYKRVVRRFARGAGERYTEARARLRTTAPGERGFFHDAGFYRSDEEFRRLVVPFAEEGVAAKERVVFAYDARKTDLLRRWLPVTPLVTYLAEERSYPSPGKMLARWRHVAEEAARAGAGRVRVAGDLRHSGSGRPYAGWDRYEAAVDRALGDLSIWGRCLYDLRSAPADVVASARRHHRHVLTPSGALRASEDYVPVLRLSEFLRPLPDPLEQEPPARTLVDPPPATARAAVRAVAGARLGADRLDELLLATSEAVTNALLHGRPPVTVRIWVTGDRLVVAVHDRGRGPEDPLVGLVLGGEPTRRGLFMAHQLDVDVALLVVDDGFAVRLRVPIAPALVAV